MEPTSASVGGSNAGGGAGWEGPAQGEEEDCRIGDLAGEGSQSMGSSRSQPTGYLAEAAGEGGPAGEETKGGREG